MALKQTCTSRIVLFVLKVTSFIIIILEERVHILGSFGFMLP